MALQEARHYFDLTSVQSIELHSDSQYVVSNYKTAMFQWAASRWRNREGRPVANADLWKDLIRLMKKCYPLRVNFHWVKGHSSDKRNKAVDKLAKKSAKNPLNPPLTIVDVRRKKTEKPVETGSVGMRRQRLKIRIITSEYLRVQRVYKYQYEVLSTGSRYFGNVDWIFSHENLKVGHHYEVSVNRNTSNPSITRLIREIER
jgi:ribonuclease HI